MLRVSRRDDDRAIDFFTEMSSAAKEAYGPEAHLPRRTHRQTNVLGVSARAHGDEDIPRSSEGANLPLKDAVEAEVVRVGREDGSVGRERDGREARPPE